MLAAKALRYRGRKTRSASRSRQSCLMSLNLPEDPDGDGCAGDVRFFQGGCEVYPDIVTIAPRHLELAVRVETISWIGFVVSRGYHRTGVHHEICRIRRTQWNSV